MGYINDIMASATELGTVVNTIQKQANDIKGKIAPKSMAGKASEGTLQFPCITTDSISVQFASTLTKTLERVYASFVQAVLSLNSTINISTDGSPVDFLRRFHTNVKMESADASMLITESADIDASETFMNAVKTGTCDLLYNEAANALIMFNTADMAVRSIYESNKDQLQTEYGFVNVSAIPLGTKIVTEGVPVPDRTYSDVVKAGNTAIPTLLKDKDVIKLNDMQPYQMSVKLMAVNDKKEFVQFMEFIAGVKVVLHMKPSNAIITEIVSSFADNGSKFATFIKWTTGEKSLFKDIIFNINGAKEDAIAKTGKWSKPLMNLKNKKAMNVFNKGAVPNATLVVGRYEVDFIKDTYKIDLTDTVTATDLCKKLFLMTLVIVDDATETIKVFYTDTGEGFQLYSKDILDKEVMTNSNKFGKELVRMISKT